LESLQNQKIHQEKGHERFIIIGGSWSATKIIANPRRHLFSSMLPYANNDIDVYFGDFAEYVDSKLIVA